MLTPAEGVTLQLHEVGEFVDTSLNVFGVPLQIVPVKLNEDEGGTDEAIASTIQVPLPYVAATIFVGLAGEISISDTGVFGNPVL
jgi:hypothetical protein